MITLTRIKNKYHFDSPSLKEIKLFQKILTFPVEGAEFSEKYKKGWWDGTDKLFSPVKKTFDFGLLEYVKNNRKGIKLHLDEGLCLPLVLDIQNELLRPYQKNAVIALFKYRHGIVKVPTRGGKTYIASECIKQAMGNGMTKILFVVDSVELMNQSIEEISTYLNIDRKDIGIIQEQYFDIKSITCATIQTINTIFTNKRFTGKVEDVRAKIKAKRLKQKLLKALLDELDFLIVDEIHEFMSEDRSNFIRKCKNTKLSLYLSATPFKSDPLNNLKLSGVTGGIIYEISEEELIETGVLARNKVLLVIMEHQTRDDNYRESTRKSILENDDRDCILLLIMYICMKLSLKTLMMFVSKDYGRKIADLSGEKFISGDDNIFERKMAKDEFLKGEGKVMLASDIWKKGITLPAVEVLVNCNGGKEETAVIQKKGRVLGTTEDKSKAVIIDIIDIEDKYLSDHSLSRINVYERSVGRVNIDVVEYDDPEFESIVTEFLRNWFEI
jgi:superfamily II DNA or RNA helicase